MNLYQKFIIFLIIAMPWHISACAFNLDETVNDEIRKNYNDTKLIEDSGIRYDMLDVSPDENLPELPSITKTQTSSKPADIKNNTVNVPQTYPETALKNRNIKIKKGTSFNVVNLNAISDWQIKGTSVKFKTKSVIQKKAFQIPVGTVFTGEIVESHQPQITCNGGLVVIKIYSMQLYGQTIPLNAYVIRANDKKVFFNDIKGNRTYLKTLWKHGNWGRTLFNKMLNLTVNLGGKSSTIVLSPFPLAYGTICLGVNAIVSPVTAFFSKGGHVSIPADSKFILKLSDDVYIN